MELSYSTGTHPGGFTGGIPGAEIGRKDLQKSEGAFALLVQWFLRYYSIQTNESSEDVSLYIASKSDLYSYNFAIYGIFCTRSLYIVAPRYLGTFFPSRIVRLK